MKSGIHPQYFTDSKVSCVCGNTFTTGSTLPEIRIDVCSNCHPLFTGEMKYADTLGKVEKFQKAQEKAKQFKVKKQEVAKVRQERTRPNSLREMLTLAQKQASS